jgi:exopolysaccharide production protein ExoQ
VSKVASLAPARSAHGRSSPDGSVFTRFIFAVFLIFLFPSFLFQFAINPVTQEFTGSPLLQAINVGCVFYSIGMIFGSRETSKIVVRCWPVLFLVGLAFGSAAWSYNPNATLRASYAFLTATLLGLAMAGRLSPLGCVRLRIRTMVFGCLLSILWVFIFPEVAVHQVTDVSQIVHAGLWRGIFSHKQGLGVFAGLTTGLLLFYGSSAFSLPPLRIGALCCSVTCLWGTQSVTGLLTATVTAGMLYATYWIAWQPLKARKSMMVMLAVVLLILYVCSDLGIFDYFVRPLLGKSSDLSGRRDIWNFVLDNLRSSGSSLLGGGLNGGFVEYVSPGFSIDNGYIEKLVEFGYLGGSVIFAVYGWIIWKGTQLIMQTRSVSAATAIFPFNVMFAMLFVNISESNFMSKHISSVLVAIAACQIAKQQFYHQRQARNYVHGKNLNPSG